VPKEPANKVTREMVVQLFLKAFIEASQEGLTSPGTGLEINDLTPEDMDTEESFLSGLVSSLDGSLAAAGVNIKEFEDPEIRETMSTGRGFRPEDIEIFLNNRFSGGKSFDFGGKPYTLPNTLMHESLHAIPTRQGKEDVAQALSELVRTGKFSEALKPQPISRVKQLTEDDFDILAGIVRLFEDKLGVSSSTGKDF